MATQSTHIAQFGLIHGGSLDGWRYGFRHFSWEGPHLFVHVLATQPGWPFPKEVRLEVGAGDFDGLGAVRGERAKRLDAQKLIEEARPCS